jgi:hypothetical protein
MVLQVLVEGCAKVLSEHQTRSLCFAFGLDIGFSYHLPKMTAIVFEK